MNLSSESGGGSQAPQRSYAPDQRDADVLVVGAGPAGFALGCAAADAGLSVLLLEQQAERAVSTPIT